ncbi:MAG: hypothetical protein LBV14_05415 [Acidovorax sp.]|jgi:hypothetical protein|nr:hypothetical protein [Acidovorax sp.]
MATKHYTPPHSDYQGAELQTSQRVIETTATAWWPTNSPTRCISCGAEHQPGQELACGH